MFHKEHSDKKNIFVNKTDKKKESKTAFGANAGLQAKGPPHVHTKISAYDRIVQLVTNDRSEVNPQQDEQKKKSSAYECLKEYFFLPSKRRSRTRCQTHFPSRLHHRGDVLSHRTP